MSELFCEKHGPYNAARGQCPYCSGSRQPFDPGQSSEVETTPSGAYGGTGYSDDDETVLPGKARRGGLGGSEDETALPGRGQRGNIDLDATQLPERVRKKRILDDDYSDDDLDETVLERQDRAGLMGWLIVKKGIHMQRGAILKVRPGAIFGRSTKKADIVVDDDKVSSVHARFQLKDNQFILVDLGSSNGTWVNGEEALGPTPLKQDDEIKIGDTIFVLKTL